jgi:hypothetical protein
MTCSGSEFGNCCSEYVSQVASLRITLICGQIRLVWVFFRPLWSRLSIIIRIVYWQQLRSDYETSNHHLDYSHFDSHLYRTYSNLYQEGLHGCFM